MSKAKEFLICSGILMIRTVKRVECCYSSLGMPMGTGAEVTMRPATIEEVADYQLSRDDSIRDNDKVTRDHETTH